MAIRDAGFGHEVRAAMAGRQQWLVEQQLADGDGDRIRLRANAIMMLQRRELLRVGDELTSELGKPFVQARVGDRIEGKIGRRVSMESGSYAIVERSRDFTLVPWRDVFERNLGKALSGIMRADGVSWQFARGRSGPTIS